MKFVKGMHVYNNGRKFKFLKHSTVDNSVCYASDEKTAEVFQFRCDELSESPESSFEQARRDV